MQGQHIMYYRENADKAKNIIESLLILQKMRIIDNDEVEAAIRLSENRRN